MALPITLSSLNFQDAVKTIEPLVPFVAAIVIYALFIFTFYRWLARKDIFRMNLGQYNTASRPILKKALAVLLYVVEYLFLFPIFAFIWFAVLTTLLVFLAKNQGIDKVLFASITIVSAVRISTYFSEDLSRELAKLLPLTLLALYFMDVTYFSFSASLAMLTQTVGLYSTMIYYLLFIMIIEFTMRIGYILVRPLVKQEASTSSVA
ncbi:hypothetical protein HYW21_00160 [Candidatus Woesearchaeota archaeon]|nr:hypothetical protein [Candidatus Woesearchaeota archaeon]